MKKLFTLLCIAGVTGVVSCKKDTFNPASPETSAINAGKNGPEGFTFRTSKDVTVDLALRSGNEEALPGVMVRIYEPTADSLQLVYKGITDNNGKLNAKINVEAGTSQLVVDPAYIGLLRNAKVNLKGTSTSVVIGGKNGFSGDITPTQVSTNNRKVFALRNQGGAATNFTYPAPYTSTRDAVYDDVNYPLFLGMPKYMETTVDNVTPRMLRFINNSLPEYQPVMKHHPEYLQSNVMPVIRVIKKTEVTLTFVWEGASYLNTLAYYTYPTNNPPKSADEVKNATYVFPNASVGGDGGALRSGHKVKLGTFEAGTSIGFIVLRNSWTGSDIQTNVAKFYSNDAFNPETNSSLKKHTVLLNDDEHKQFIVGFEDITRDEAECDHDFNDVVFYVKSAVADAIDDTDVPIIDKNEDTDGDGVNDDKDEYPTDPERAYNDYYPSKNQFAQFGFEDNWPTRGDYDMNDLVINYRYQYVLNAQNKVVDLYTMYKPIAAGSSYRNGFGMQLPVSASVVKSVSGQKIINNYISFAGNGVEAGQSKAVIIPFDHQDAVIKYDDGAFFVNTMMDKEKVEGRTINVKINFVSPLNRDELSPSEFNPFLICNLKRGYEVHLPGYKPTDKADPSIFGQENDDTNPAKGKYYLSKNNWPWAISYKYTTKYAIETVNINQAFLHFSEWVASGGTQYPDWYNYRRSGYTNQQNLYLK